MNRTMRSVVSLGCAALMGMLVTVRSANAADVPDAWLTMKTKIALMTTDRLNGAQRAAAKLFVGEHSGWGLGMATPAAGDAVKDVPHGFGWTGGTGTVWYSDPDTGLTGVLLTQRGMTSPQQPEVMADFWRLAYEALRN